MSSRFLVRTLTLAGGERLPLLVERATGVPPFKPNIFALTEVRQRNRATATILRTLRELIVLFDFLADHGISLDERMWSGRFLALGEVDALAQRCRVFAGGEDQNPESTPLGPDPKMLSLEKVRMRRAKAAPEAVAPQTAANRIRTLHAYLTWLTSSFLSENSLPDTLSGNLRAVVADALGALLRRIPSFQGRNVLGQREGLPDEVLDRILTVVNPESPENPWRDRFVRSRNVLIIYMLRKLGLRRGELLNIKIPDIDFRNNQVGIYRRADDPNDPRVNQPRVKTRDRILPLSESLVEAIEHHIRKERSLVPGAHKHGHLFLTERRGKPMSLDALNKLFRVLRERVPDLPDDLSPHVLRHDWNDEFSKKMDAKGVSEEEEKRYRAYLQGWSPTSATAQTYTRRHVRNKAMGVSLAMQADEPNRGGEKK